MSKLIATGAATALLLSASPVLAQSATSAGPIHPPLGAGGDLGAATDGGLGGNLGAKAPGTAPAGPGVSPSGRVTGSIGAPDVNGLRGPVGKPAARPDAEAKATIEDGRSLARGGPVSTRDVNPTISAEAAAARGVDVSESAGLVGGLSLRGRNGQSLGRITEVVRNRTGQVTRLTVKTSDGTLRSLPPGGVRVEGDSAITSYSASQIKDLPRARH